MPGRGLVAESSPDAVSRLRPTLGCSGNVAGKLVVLPLPVPDGFGLDRFLGLIFVMF